MMTLDCSSLHPAVVRILDLGESGNRLMPLVCGAPASAEAVRRLRSASATVLFPGALCPEGARAGLLLYFSCFQDCHNLAQNLESAEGSYWHAILHRQEPDDWNAGYWFRRVGSHSVFTALREHALALGYEAGDGAWDPFAFVAFCAEARLQPGSHEARLACQVQLVEWQLLFLHCARATMEMTP